MQPDELLFLDRGQAEMSDVCADRLPRCVYSAGKHLIHYSPVRQPTIVFMFGADVENSGVMEMLSGAVLPSGGVGFERCR